MNMGSQKLRASRIGSMINGVLVGVDGLTYNVALVANGKEYL